MRRKKRKALAVAVTSLFLAAHIVCVCDAPAHATARMLAPTHVAAAAVDPHACCHRHDPHAPTRTLPRPCLHCAPAAVAAPETAKVVAPLLHLPSVLPTVAVAPRLVAARPLPSRHAPPDDPRATVVLRL